jgi:amino acid adenylation domain-containing protein
MDTAYSDAALPINVIDSNFPAEDVFVAPLSFSQQRLWFLHQLDPESAAYNMQAAVRIQGSLDILALERSLNEVVRRHETLRTSFIVQGEHTLQVITPELAFQVEHVDLRELPRKERESDVQRLARQAARTPFALEQAPLLRANLLWLDNEEYVLVLLMDHIISDGWSSGVLIKELCILYQAYSTNQPSPLGELEIQYVDYAQWQREWLTGQVLEDQLAYWKRQLEGSIPVLELPADRPPAAVQFNHAATQILELSKSLSENLKTLSQRQGATLFMTLLAAFQTLLYRYTGQTDLVVGTPIAGRTQPETEDLIGCFVNTLVLRSDLSGDPAFIDVLKRAREVTFAAHAHQDLPFELLVEELRPERSLSHAPFFDVMLVLHPPLPEIQLPGLTIKQIEVESETAKFDLMFSFRESEQGLIGFLEYRTERFDGSTIKRMGAHFERLLEGIVADPGQRLSALPLLAPTELQQLLREWNDTATDYPHHESLHELFAEQVKRDPEAVALISGDVEISYGELNSRANQLAHHLQRLGVGPEVIVGLCLERSVEMVVGLLGILKAGGAYLPLDPQYPLERLHFMLEDAGVPVLLTQEHLLASLPTHWSQVVCLDTDWEVISQYGVNQPAVSVSADNLAYVMYTSGSTGTPKGVSVVHRNVVRLTKDTNYACFDSDEVFLQFAPISFDASTFEIWGSLLNGAKLVIMPPQLPSIAELGEALQRHGVTTLWLTAGLFQLVVDERLEHLRGVRQLLAGGDALSLAHVKRVLASLSDGSRLINGYGPTEGTTFSCCYVMDKESQVGTTVPIGRPIANAEAYILDQQQQPVPLGAAGELYLGGDGLARCYLNRPALTAEKFIPHPLSGKPGARLYRTGDRVRFLPDGNIEFLGRLDQQVKIRGFRIELGEIEAVMAGFPAVKEAVVLAQADGPGEKRLAAYVVLKPEQSQSSGDLKLFLQKRLPDYMVPSTIIVLAEMPLTRNGKVDRRALPAVDQLQAGTGNEFAAPRTPIEEMLAGIWSEVLNLERVGAEDDFFELGGHSLLATQLLSRVRETFQVDIALRHVFEQPTLAGFAGALNEALRAEHDAQAPAILPVSREQALPLSFAQQRLWFLDQLISGSALYNIPVAVRLSGCLNVTALEETLSEVVRRHEVLRTTFAIEAGIPTQVIHPPQPLPLDILDLSEIDEDAKESHVWQIVEEEAKRPFDLAGGPLLRASLVRISEQEHIALIMMHHIVSDGWSMGVLVKEVRALYEAFAEGKPSPLPELVIQYADFAFWEQSWLSGERLEKELSYWSRQLDGAPGVLELPLDRPRTTLAGHRGSSEPFALSAALSDAVKELSKKEGVTLFMTLLAAWQVLLGRYSGQHDVSVGTPIANRNRLETEPLIGFFVNTLVLRVNFADDPSFLELLPRVREVFLGAYAHQDLPFEKLVEQLPLQRSLHHSPLFQVTFTLQNAPLGPLKLPGLKLSLMQVPAYSSKFDLLLTLQEFDDCLTGTLEYDSDLFDSSTIRRMIGNFQTLLEGIVANPSQPLSALPLLTTGEIEQLREWNDTASGYPRNNCLHELFEEQVERHPQAVALIFGEAEVSYAELNKRANQLAHYLRRLGVGPEVRVGLCLDRSVEMVVAVLGILKAGGAYLPLDPQYPLERLHFMLEDAGIAVLLTQEHLRALLPTHPSEVICLDTEWAAISEGSAQNPVNGACADNLAYVMYTSGSTGKPKGVSITHRNVVRLVKETDYACFGADEVFLQMAPISFDASTFELWGSLLNGARLVIMPAHVPSLIELGEVLKRYEVTTLWLTAGLFHLMVEEGPEALRGVRQLLAGGDVLSVAHVRKVLGNLRAGSRLINGYGPTESTTFTCCYALDKDSQIGASVPLGGPIANTDVYVLNEQQQPVPVGVAGELYIGGDGLARGYLNRPDLTAEKFIPHPFSEEKGERLYRTGDRVRFLATGSLEFLGRVDQQVKIRGYRIELGELEAAMSEFSGVKEAVAMAQADGAGEKRLVGYVVWQEDQLATISDLKIFLQRRLPEYLVPSSISVLKQMPLTANGKVDRRALQAPETVEPGTVFVAPRTPVEEMLAEIWCELLELEHVGAHDDFFALGGHSLLATQLLSRVHNTFHVDLALRHVFEQSTLAGFAETLSEASRAQAGKPVPPIVPVSRDQLLPLSFAQQRLWFIEQLEPAGAAYHIPQVLRIKGSLNIDALEKACNEIVRRHEILRTIFVVDNGEPVQVITPFKPTRIPLVDLSSQLLEDCEAASVRICTEEVQRPFDLEQGPLLRLKLLRLGSEEYLLIVTMHHIVTDGWSFGVLVGEVTTLYQAFLSDNASPLPELPIQYADYAYWQRQWSVGEDEEQLEYWRRQLGALPILELPTDRPRPSQLSYRGRQLPFEFSESLTRRLKQLRRERGATLFMILLAGFQILLHRYTGQEDIVVGTPIANRQRLEIENLIGFFVNTLALRVDLSGAPTFSEVLARVREVSLGGYAHQDIPFERLVQELQPGRDLSRNPLFQVLFALQNAPSEKLELPGLTLTPEEFESGSTRFDLECLMWEQGEGLRGLFVYSEDLFDEATVRRMLASFEVLLNSIANAPDEPINALPFLTEEDERQQLVAWNDTAAVFPHEQCVHQLVAQQAQSTPEATALVFGTERLNYRELNARANQLAHYLQKMGVGRETTVGIMMERSTEMLISVLGTLKAGGAYLPLDPEFPRDRLSFMLADAGARMLLTQHQLLDLLPEINVEVVCPARDWEQIALEDEDDPADRSTPDNLAYVIYTSGSTGKPKGVAMPHGPLVNLIRWQAKLSPGATRTLQFASLSFDVSFQEIFSTWCTGGALILVGEETRRDSQELLRTLVQGRIDRLFLPYVALQHLAQVAVAENMFPQNLRQVITAGEQLKITREIRSLFGKLVNCSLDNQYGPSETHVASGFILAGATEEWPGLPPIGRPIANTELYVLDTWMRPVALGATGELYIGGECLARGYLNRPEMTAERFTPNPFASHGGRRLYRTGDLVRYMPDGVLHFLGRRDHQAKVRGYRIEMGEVEIALRQHPSARDAVVIAHEARTGEKRLVAYVLVDRETDLTTNDLRSHLIQKLPEYMIPSTFVMLDHFPLTPGGKIDRLALPGPEQIELSEERVHVAPRTPTEQLLAGLWADVLGVEQVGIHDDFFDLGGHSLMATRLISRVREAFRIELPVRSLFVTPTLAALSETIETEMRSGEDRQELPLLPVLRTGELPLSFAQQRMWFLNQLDPDSATYNISSAIRLAGQLNKLALELSFSEIVRRHEALRTTFGNMEGRAVQVIAPAAPMILEVDDLSLLPPTEREVEARRLAREEARAPFKLALEPLLRARLLKLTDEEHVLLLTMHHIISDGWSMSVLVSELTTLYPAFAAGRSQVLPELPIQYADFAVWQKHWLTGEVLARQLSYWKRQLAGTLPLLELPSDRPRPSVQSYHGAQHSLELSIAVSKRLKEISRQYGATLFMTLLAAFKLLLSRYTAEEDIIIGTPIAGRNRTELEGLIGFLVNTLVLRTDLSGNPRFHELLNRVREVTLQAFQHQELPFEKLVDVLQPARDPSHTPLFQILFTFQNPTQTAMTVHGLDLSVIELPDETAKFDLILMMSERGERIAGTFVYNTDLFEAATIERLGKHFCSLLEAIVANPSQRLSALPLLADEERGQLLEWGQNRTDYPRHKGIADLFEEQVEGAPETVALVCQDVQLTYRQLNERANQLARYLWKLGVKPNTVVGLCLERSVEMIVALLGILKAGGAYLPLDSSYPQERLNSMLADAQIRILLTQQSLAGRLPEDQVRLVLLDAEWPEIARESKTTPERGLTSSDSLAYVMYTSGSTGLAKGVCVTQRNVIRLIRQTNYIEFDADQIFLQLAPISFDASTFEIWGSLLNGARLILMPGKAPTLVELGAMLEKHQVTTLWLTAGLFHQMVDYHPESLRSLRYLLAGGDVLSVQHVKRVLQRLPGIHLINGYGPTESTTFACCYGMRESGDVGATVAIGKPIANTDAYVLDAQMQMVPLGIAGELYIGGDGLARGYLNSPGLTAERFVPHPFSAAAGARLYRTGDMVRYLADGNLEFLGRYDDQVKVRGFRIELGEVELALAQHPAVKDALIVAQKEVAGDRRLLAYVVPDGEDVVSSSELRRFMKEKLPEYMVPSAFVILEALPLTPNGKIDRRALPLPAEAQAKEDIDHLPPRTAVEDILVNIWADVLDLRSVRPDDNFFELGGHSLLATRVIARIRTAFQVELPLQELFLNPTVVSLAQSVESALQGEDSATGPPFERVSREHDLPLSFAQQRLWFVDQLQPNSTAYHLPVALRLQGVVDVPALKRSLSEVMRRHEVLRTVFRMKAGQPLQVVLPAQELALPLIDLSELQAPEREAEVLQLCLSEVQRPFDLENGPLVRSSIIQVDEDERILLLVMHHIVGDAWSLEILVREVTELYQAFSAGQPSPLLDLSMQYADYAHWQRQWLQGEVLARLLAYWKRRLDGAPSLLELPADRPRPPVQSVRGAKHPFMLPAELSEALKKLSQREGVTLFMTLLAAFQTLLYRYTDQEDIVVGADINGRNRLETEQMIGFFINMLVLRVNLSGNPTFKELLNRVRKTALGAYAHQDVPLEKLVEELQPERNLSYSPLFQVVFNFNNGSTQMPALPDLRMSPLELDFTEVKFDLSLFMWDRADGLSGMWTYSSDLFEAERVRRMHEHFVTLLQSIVENSERRLNALEYLTEAELNAQTAARIESKEKNRQRFKGVRPRTITRSKVSLIQTEMLRDDAALPLVIRPDAEAVDLSLWARDNLDFIDGQLLRHGALLFRNFEVRSMADFVQFTGSISPELLDYSEPSSPRTELSNKIYTSTEYPPDQWIQLHNEMSYAHNWPRTIYFFCQQPAPQGGETPIAFSRKVFQLLDPKIREHFMQRKVMYVRNFGDGLDLPWQHVFQTTDRGAVEAYCRNAQVEYEWKGEGRLKTRQVRQAVIKHPRTGETVWFNQAHAFHVSTLDAAVRELLLSEKTEESFPRNSYYGDGSLIESSVIAEIREVYRQAAVTFTWEPGDILMLDNMQVAHGRAPYVGNRKVLVAMSGRVSSLDVDVEGASA